MSFIIGKDDRIGIVDERSENNHLGPIIKYSNPSYDHFFSEYGFCIPLDDEGVPIDYILNDKFPTIGNVFEPYPSNYRFLRVTPEGELFRVFIVGDTKKISQRPIINSMDSWWFIHGDISEDYLTDTFMGFLSTNPSYEAIEEIHKRRNMGKPLRWVSISDLVDRMKTTIKTDEYPKSDD